MNKQEVLHSLKELIIDIRDNAEVIRKNEKFSSDWAMKRQKTEAGLSGLSERDNKWVTSEYAKFFKEEIEPSIPSK